MPRSSLSLLRSIWQAIEDNVLESVKTGICFVYDVEDVPGEVLLRDAARSEDPLLLSSRNRDSTRISVVVCSCFFTRRCHLLAARIGGVTSPAEGSQNLYVSCRNSFVAYLPSNFYSFCVSHLRIFNPLIICLSGHRIFVHQALAAAPSGPGQVVHTESRIRVILVHTYTYRFQEPNLTADSHWHCPGLPGGPYLFGKTPIKISQFVPIRSR